MIKKTYFSAVIFLIMHGVAFTMQNIKMINRALCLELKRHSHQRDIRSDTSKQPDFRYDVDWKQNNQKIDSSSKNIESKKKLTKEKKTEMIMMGAVGLLAGSIFLVILKDCKDNYHREKYNDLCREHYVFPRR